MRCRKYDVPKRGLVEVALLAGAGRDGAEDRCYVDQIPDLIPVYTRWRDGVKATGRPIVISASTNQGKQDPWRWAGDVSDLWRISSDTHDTFAPITVDASVWRPRPGARFVPRACRRSVRSIHSIAREPTRNVLTFHRPHADLPAKVASRLGFLFPAPQVSSPVHPAT